MKKTPTSRLSTDQTGTSTTHDQSTKNSRIMHPQFSGTTQFGVKEAYLNTTSWLGFLNYTAGLQEIDKSTGASMLIHSAFYAMRLQKLDITFFLTAVTAGKSGPQRSFANQVTTPSSTTSTVYDSQSLTKKKLLLIAWKCAIYLLWTERNSRLHRRCFRSPTSLLSTLNLTFRNRWSSLRSQNTVSVSAMIQMWLR